MKYLYRQTDRVMLGEPRTSVPEWGSKWEDHPDGYPIHHAFRNDMLKWAGGRKHRWAKKKAPRRALLPLE
jgi:hypothetical protein